LQLRDAQAGLDGDRHVTGGVVDDGIQGRQVEADAGDGRRQADAELGAAAEGVDGGGAADLVAQRGHGVGPDDRQRETIDVNGFGHGKYGIPGLEPSG
jgi:hypothetical protein